jgi:hypothetical protein
VTISTYSVIGAGPIPTGFNLICYIMVRAAEFRSVMTTLLLTHKKVLVGAVSTRFVNVHTPTAIQIDTLGIYGVAAADHLHTLLGDESIETRAKSMSRRLQDEAEVH